ncbi:MAG: hypothetical protein JW829_02170 [Pirellulales bacterium]|nr:hypothetical protein [Pirellulales bacterium]
MEALELFNAGSLAQAIVVATDGVRKDPTDTDVRFVLAELLCFRGEFGRADTHLDTIMNQDPSTAIGVSLMRHLIRAETWRRECFDKGRLPEFLSEPTEPIKHHLQLLVALRENDTGRAAELSRTIDDIRPFIPGSRRNHPFDDFRDTDDICCAFLEVLTGNGKYYWLPHDDINQMEVHEPKRPCDILWPRVTMETKSGINGDVYIPAIYEATRRQDKDSLILGREVAWDEGEPPIRGLGMRTYWIGDEAIPLLDFGMIVFDTGAT